MKQVSLLLLSLGYFTLSQGIFLNSVTALFLINPAGIIFGEGARLDIGGSFLGSTADSIVFPDGEFSATNLANPPLITINAPIGLSFRDNPGDIINRAGFTELENGNNIQESGLEVNRGQAITLVGGNINLENGRLTAPGGRIELGGLATAGTIELNEDLSLNFSGELTRADVTLTGFAEIDVTSGGGGNISIFANNIDILGGSDICAGIGADGACGGRNTDLGSVDAQAGDINFNAIETITIEGGFSVVNNNLNNSSVGNAGSINIETGSLIVKNGGRINNRTFGQGDVGSINISASDTITFENGENSTFIRSNVETEAVGNSGGVNITTISLFVNNGAQIQSLVRGNGNSGKVTINAQDLVSFDGRDVGDFPPSGVFTGVEVDGISNDGTGGIEINANSLSIRPLAK